MAQDVTLFNQTQLVIPDYVRDFMVEEANIPPRSSVPTLSYRGRRWTTILNGESKVLVRPTPEGVDQPISMLRLIILDATLKRGRTYYSGAWDKDNPKPPDCWSPDGEKPSETVQTPQAPSCATCPKAAKGSKINELGKPVAACSMHRLLAVIPAGNLDHPPMRFKISVTSDYDSNSKELANVGWFAFRNYQDYLRSRDVLSTAGVITRVMFDPNVDYAKVVFSGESLITDRTMLTKLRDLRNSEEVKSLITENWDIPPAPEEMDDGAAGAATPGAGEPFITQEMDKETRTRTTRTRTRTQTATQPVQQQAAPQPEKTLDLQANQPDDPFSAGGAAQPVQQQAAPQPAQQQTSSAVPDDVANILSAWGS